jgi:hypothetical protein
MPASLTGSVYDSAQVIARLERWAATLPLSETIPISAAEAFEVAAYFEQMSIFHRDNPLSADRQAAIFDSVLAGRFKFCGHRVVIL